MNLPNYFFADLPPEAVLTPAMLTEACQTLKRNRARFLVPRTTGEIIRLLDDVAQAWRRPDYPLRKLALEHGPTALQFSPPTLERGLESFFAMLTGENLEALIARDLGHSQRLDQFASSPLETRNGFSARVRGPELLFHIAAGNIPNPALLSLVLGLLTRSAQMLKCASGTTLLPRLFAHSIYEHDPKLGACLEVAEWAGGNDALESAVFQEADCVTVTASDETLLDVRRRLPLRCRFLGHGHRVSFGFVTREALDSFGAQRWVENAATDILAWDQRGCLSPQVVYAEDGGRMTPEQFAGRLAEELARREAREPRGAVSSETSAAIQARRGFYEIRAAHLPGTCIWSSQGSTAWTVVCESDPVFPTSGLPRFILVHGVKSPAEALQAAGAVQGQVSTVGIGATDQERLGLTQALAGWGVMRICPLGRMQNPPLTWHHDGRSTLAELVTWADLEE